MSELTRRILFAVPAAALFILVTWAGGWIFHGTIILICLLIVHELLRLCEQAGFPADPFFPYSISLLVLLLPIVPYGPQIGLALFLLFLLLQAFRPETSTAGRVISTFFSSLFVSGGLLTLLMIRATGLPEHGFSLVLVLVMMVWGNDVFAYFGGKSFGRRLLAPAISPNKTWEGFFFGIAGAAAGLAVVWLIVPGMLPAPLLMLLPGALLVSIFGPIGDLTESRLKRAAGVKDSATLLPGHGGFFDRFDALLLAAPAFYLYLFLLSEWGYLPV